MVSGPAAFELPFARSAYFASTSRPVKRIVPIVGTSLRRSAGSSLSAVSLRPKPLQRVGHGKSGEGDRRRCAPCRCWRRSPGPSARASAGCRAPPPTTASRAMRPTACSLALALRISMPVASVDPELEGLEQVGEDAEQAGALGGRGVLDVLRLAEDAHGIAPRGCRRPRLEIRAGQARDADLRAVGLADGEIVERERGVYGSCRSRRRRRRPAIQLRRIGEIKAPDDHRSGAALGHAGLGAGHLQGRAAARQRGDAARRRRRGRRGRDTR